MYLVTLRASLALIVAEELLDDLAEDIATVWSEI
jgi:hypothetical protein